MSIRTEIRAFLRGFKFAAKGIIHCICTQRNFRFHMGAAGAVIWLSTVCRVDRFIALVLSLCIGGVMAMECVNTAVEYAVDQCVGKKRTLLAMYAKDCAAGAVLMFSFAAAFVGGCVFLTGDRPGILRRYFFENAFHGVLGLVYVLLWGAWVFVCFGKNRSVEDNKDL